MNLKKTSPIAFAQWVLRLPNMRKNDVNARIGLLAICFANLAFRLDDDL
jgi:hypothetical protein